MIVNSSIRPSNSEMRCVETKTVRCARRAFLIGADDRLDELAADDRIESGRRLVEHEQIRLRTDRGDERQLGALAFRQVTGLFASGQPKAIEQRPFGLAIPLRSERGRVFQRVAHGHPRIEADLVGHVREPRS